MYRLIPELNAGNPSVTTEALAFLDRTSRELRPLPPGFTHDAVCTPLAAYQGDREIVTTTASFTRGPAPVPPPNHTCTATRTSQRTQPR